MGNVIQYTINTFTYSLLYKISFIDPKVNGTQDKEFLTKMLVKRLTRYPEVEGTPQKHAGIWSMGKRGILE